MDGWGMGAAADGKRRRIVGESEVTQVRLAVMKLEKLMVKSDRWELKLCWSLAHQY